MISHLIERIKEKYNISNHIISYNRAYEFDNMPTSLFELTELYVGNLKFICSGVDGDIFAYRIAIGNWFIDTRHDICLHFKLHIIYIDMIDKVIKIKNVRLIE